MSDDGIRSFRIEIPQAEIGRRAPGGRRPARRDDPSDSRALWWPRALVFDRRYRRESGWPSVLPGQSGHPGTGRGM